MIIQNNNPYTQASFSLSNRIARMIWGAVWLFLFRPSPRPFHAWRKFILVLFGAKLGKHNHIYPSAKIWAPWNLTCGDYVGIGDGANIYNMAHITIGEYSVVSQGAYLCAGSHDYNSANFQLITAPIELKPHVWICVEAFLHMGVVIPEGAVIGARSVVTKSPETPWTVYAGMPVKAISARNKNR
jgi:putative colanic acid biosynthesis acetyltransferase WcaF